MDRWRNEVGVLERVEGPLDDLLEDHQEGSVQKPDLCFCTLLLSELDRHSATHRRVNQKNHKAETAEMGMTET
jgi:hypothetical protein